MSKKIDFGVLQNELKEKVKEFYPYFFAFYILAVIGAFFSRIWSSFFYWPAFNGAIIFFGLIFIYVFKSTRKFDFRFLIYIWSRVLRIRRRTWLNLFIIAVVLTLSCLKGISILNFVVLAFALISILFVLDSRLAAGLTLILLASCPLWLILQKNNRAEDVAIYAYYFLVITVVTLIRESFQTKSNNSTKSEPR